MMKQLDLKRLSEALPIHAEEGSVRESVAESQLIEALSDVPQDEGAASAIDVLRRLFQRLRLLDESALRRAHWVFASFPAYLMGRSIVEMLGADSGGWFEEGYWQNSVHVERQRSLLREMEERRVYDAPAIESRPIRFVTVAWGLVRMGNKFLLHHREDKARDKDWVFPGGRFSLDDAPADARDSLLRRLYFGDHEAASAYLPRTLAREIREELNLSPETDFTFERFRAIDPYRKVAGLKNNNAYTEYRITIFALHLTDEGEARFFEAISDSSKFAWFSIDDLVGVGRRPDGKTAFIDALREQFEPQAALRRLLDSAPESSRSYRFSKDTDAVDIPASVDAAFRRGKTGKEKEVQVALRPDELALLTVLAAHGRDLELAASQEHLTLLSGGRIRLDSSAAMACAMSLVRKLESARIPIVQMTSTSFIRLAIEPQWIHFSEASFQYVLSGYKLSVVLRLETDPWAESLSVERVLDELDPTITLLIRRILKDGSLWKSDDILKGIGDFDRAMRTKLDDHLNGIGLRKLIRTCEEDYMINVPGRSDA